MKKALKVLFAAALCVVAVTSACLHASAASGRISVTGSGSYEAEADLGELCFTAEGKGASTEEAVKKLEDASSALVKIASAYGSVATESFFTYTDCTGTVVAQRCYLLTSSSPKKLPEAQNKLIKGGAVTVGCPIYMLKNSSEAEIKALNLAISDAKARAKELGAAGEVSYIRDLGSGGCRFCPYCFENTDGKVIIECRVILTYGESSERRS